MGGWMDGKWVSGWVDGWMVTGWIDGGWVDGQVGRYIVNVGVYGSSEFWIVDG